MKRRAETTEETTQQILGASLNNVSEGAAAIMPSVGSLRRNIRHARQDRNMPPNPLTRDAIPILPQQYQETTTGENFLVFDSGVGDPNRIFIFGSNQGLEYLSQSGHWYADGTFKVCPELFFQLYTVHGQCYGRIFPCVYALLPNKPEATYTRFFRELFNRINNQNPTDVLVDFERGAINAIQAINNQVDVKGCFYHLSSNIWKHIQNLGLQQRYNDDQEFAVNLRMLCALAFLPPAHVIQGFDDLADHIRQNYNQDVDELLDYFEDTYIGRYRRNAPRRQPMFAIQIWNMFHRTDNELPRTNNSVEGWHRSFQAHVSSCHPVFWKFLSVLKNEENLMRVSITQHLAGHQPPAQRRRYLDCNRRILTIVDDYPNRQTIP